MSKVPIGHRPGIYRFPAVDLNECSLVTLPSEITELVRRHPGVALGAVLDGAGVLAPDEWATLFEGAFESDDTRDGVIAAVRAHAEGGSARLAEVPFLPGG